MNRPNIPMKTNEAAKPNPNLARLNVLVGTWVTVGSHPMVPGKRLHGRTTFEWIEGGAFLIMRSQIDEPEIPSGIAIFGTDEGTGACTMLYFDERVVSRHYKVFFDRDIIAWTRDAPDLSQRMRLSISADGRSIRARGEMAERGGPWKEDLSLIYTR
jgi:hypothetical protein